MVVVGAAALLSSPAVRKAKWRPTKERKRVSRHGTCAARYSGGRVKRGGERRRLRAAMSNAKSHSEELSRALRAV